MAYTSATLSLVSNGPNNGIGKLWYYSSADATTAIRVANYFSDGFARGIRAGDIILHVNSSTFAGQIFICNSATASACDVTDGLAIAATDTD